MSGKGIKVAAQLLHVQRPVGDGLSAVHHTKSPDSVRFGCNLLHRVDGAQRVGNVIYRDHLYALIKQSIHRLQVNLAVISHRDRDHFSPSLGADQLPGDNIGMMLHGRDQNLITCG